MKDIKITASKSKDTVQGNKRQAKVVRTDKFLTLIKKNCDLNDGRLSITFEKLEEIVKQIECTIVA